MVKCNDEVPGVSRTRTGTSVVEMAIVLPLLLVLVFAIGDFGIAYTRWNSLTNAVREGARVGVVYRNPCNAAAVETQVQNTVANYAASSGLDGASITTLVNGACTGTDTPLTVNATAPYNYAVLGAFDTLLGFAPTLNLRARTVMRNE